MPVRSLLSIALLLALPSLASAQPAANPVSPQAAQEQAAQQQQPLQPTPEMAAAGPAAASLTGNPEALSPVPGAAPAQQDIGQLLTALRAGG